MWRHMRHWGGRESTRNNKGVKGQSQLTISLHIMTAKRGFFRSANIALWNRSTPPDA